MHQRRRLQRVVRPLRLQIMPRQGTKLVIHQRQQPRRRILVARFHLLQQLRRLQPPLLSRITRHGHPQREYKMLAPIIRPGARQYKRAAPRPSPRRGKISGRREKRDPKHAERGTPPPHLPRSA